MKRRLIFAKETKDVAAELGLSIQQVRWAEESALRKLRNSPVLKAALVELIEGEQFHGEFTVASTKET